MNPNELVESKWMIAEEFGLKNIPKEPRVTIKDVRVQKVGGKENWGVLHFREDWAKPLKVNTTSKRALMLMFSDTDTNVWIGKRIDLYAKPGNYPKGKKVAVRIKGSPDITQVMSFSVQAFGGGEDVYNLLPTGNGAHAKGANGTNGAKPKTPNDEMWRDYRATGLTDQEQFKKLRETATGKTKVADLVAEDVLKFAEALKALASPPPENEEPPADPEVLPS